MSRKVPNILLIGAGRFGKNHLRVLQKLEKDGKITIEGVVVKTNKTKKYIEREYDVPVFLSITDRILTRVDAVDIVTPMETHFDLVKRCIKYADVFVEKPITTSVFEARKLKELAKRHNKVLMVGHIFRFHPIVEKVKSMVGNTKPSSVSSVFVSPIDTYKGEIITLEKLHYFDILDYLFNEEPDSVWATQHKKIVDASLRYPSFDACFKIGWVGDTKVRTMVLNFGDSRKIEIDFTNNTLSYTGRTTKRVEVKKKEPLLLELSTFLKAIGTRKTKDIPDASVGGRIVKIVLNIRPVVKKKIAIIGGGIFGTTAGIILGKKFDVTIFERHREIMQEASKMNQYRHHSGHHYPRSSETIEQIQECKGMFEKMYKKAIMKFPSYTCISRVETKTSPEEFEDVCKKYNLKCKREFPDGDILDRSSVHSCYKTDELAYNYEILRSEVLKKISKSPRVKLKVGHSITNAKLLKDGRKEITLKYKGKVKKETFDFVINTTYANYNTFISWLGFPLRQLEYRFKEVVVVRIPNMKKLAITVMDGPFATIVPMSEKDMFTFGDVPLSVHRKIRKFSDKDFDKWKINAKTKWKRMLKRCAKWFPILKDAEYVESRFVTLPIDTSSIKNDDRVTNIKRHGFGCFSVLEGKILTVVSISEQLREIIEG